MILIRMCSYFLFLLLTFSFIYRAFFNKNFRNLSYANRAKGTLVWLPFNRGRVVLMMILSFSWTRYLSLSFSYPIISKSITCNMHVTACSDVLHRCKYRHAMQGLACQSRDVGVFLKAGFPKSVYR